MATKGSVIQFCAGTYAQYAGLAVKDANKVYFCEDTKQIFVGELEYTKSTKILDAAPTSTTKGDHGSLYVYNGNLYLCEVSGSTYNWTRVSNVNDYAGTVTSIAAGEGLATAAGDENPITGAGTIVHAVPDGATAITEVPEDVTATFGGEITIKNIITDKFGHVIGQKSQLITMPTETELAVTNQTAEEITLGYGDTFTVVAEVAEGEDSHEIVRTVRTFKLPESDAKDTTYTISATEAGKIRVTPSEGDAYDVSLVGWDNLATKADISRVFAFKGTVANADALPTEGNVEGDVYFVTADKSEYVFVGDAWEKLGPVIDLSAYAESKDVIQRVTGAAGQVPKLTESGTLEASGFTIGASVPADAKFTDTVYEAPTYGANASGFYKVETDENGYVKSVKAVELADLTGLGAASETFVNTAVENASMKWGGIE